MTRRHVCVVEPPQKERHQHAIPKPKSDGQVAETPLLEAIATRNDRGMGTPPARTASDWRKQGLAWESGVSKKLRIRNTLDISSACRTRVAKLNVPRGNTLPRIQRANPPVVSVDITRLLEF